MSYMDLDTAEKWESWGRVPNANENVAEGLKYFNIHYFHFYENEDYSQVGDFAGYQEWKGGIKAWRALLVAWENCFAPFFPDWQGRKDMRVRTCASYHER